MESLGDKLKSAREAKGYSYEQVGKETNIARRYLEALEAEDFSKFPGEPYLFGFLRNYGEYLGLDVKELLSLYRAIKIQDQPIPVEQLLRSPPSFPKPLLVIICVFVVLAALAAAGYYFFIKSPVEPVQNPVIQLPMEYILEGSFLERRFYKGDTILVPIGDDQYKTELISMDDSPMLGTSGGSVPLNLFGETDVDLNGDGIADLQVTLSDYDRRSPAAGALIRFALKFDPVPDTGLNPALAAAQSGQSGTVIFTSTNTYPFTMDIQFQNYCMFRWEVDRRERTERYFSRGDALSIPVQNTIRLWASNATAVTIELNGAGRKVTLNLGTAGEVVVIDLRWLRDNDGRFRLTQYRLE
ncbi:MAG: helix-turn-helix domain-containing protein [Spirochaetaceae bacterium]|nr:helix-turn-helix domain-containing protein [Spirochaetaceae bacterium]